MCIELISELAGIKYFGGGPALRMPNRWNHVCVSIEYTDKGAERIIYANGKFNFQFTTAFLEEVKWLKGHNFTFGGRKFKYSGVHLNGMITDIQIFSRKISPEEMIGYTTCEKVEL
jgi:hypothetical protein